MSQVTAVKTVTFLFLFACLAMTAVAQQPIVDQFETRSHTVDGFTLPYRLFVPAGYDATKAYPLVLALHGAGERGTDNERHIRPHRLATSWADPVNQAEHPAFVVAPQVPPNGRWTADLPVDQSDFNREELTTIAILDSLAREFNIDPDRVYVTGLSMGGHGTWDLIARLPNRFAAAVPMSGTADPTQASKLLHMPIWAFHGESDTVVPPFGARGLIQALEDLGRDVVYTDCKRAPVFETNFDCPGTVSNAVLADAIEDHADLILTSVRLGGHGPWNVWYDHPLLADWLFSKHRVNPDALTLVEPSKGSVWSGVNTITWTSPGPATDVVEVWLSLNNGETWQQIDEAALGDGGYALNTANHPDAAIAQVRLFVLNEDGRVYGRQTGGPFSINNDGDAPPYLFVDDEPLRFETEAVAEAVDLTLLAADPEGSLLTAAVFYSIDGGNTFTLATSIEIPSSLDLQPLHVDVILLPNANEAQFRVEVSDGAHTTSAVTAFFVKETPRIVNDYVERIAGDGVGTITLHFIEPNNLTTHRYRIMFDASDPSAKTYAVDDLNLGTRVLTDVPLSDGVRESPIFDGMSLVVEDLEKGMANLEETGWITGDSDLGVSITGGRVRIFIPTVQLLDTENDYELTVTEAVADTSVALYGTPAQELFFTVTSRSDGARRKVMYSDAANDGRLGGGDLLYILEEDAEGALAPAWELRFSATTDTVLPEPGDTFLFVPLHKLGADDIFEFIAIEGVAVENQPERDDMVLLPGYPNPFTDRMTISYRLSTPAHVTLEVYDVLGRRIAVLLDRAIAEGAHRVDWNGRAADGARVASGLHLVRLTARPLDGGPSRTMQQAIIRVK